jgi:hypothetical protein
MSRSAIGVDVALHERAMKAFEFLTVDNAIKSRNAEPDCRRVDALFVVDDRTIREFSTGKGDAA